MTPLQTALDVAKEQDFRHVDRIRVGWHLLQEGREEEALQRAREVLSASVYHETAMRAFLCLIQAARLTLPSTHSFSEFCLMYPELLRSDALELYYSAETLLSPEARVGWIAPDLRALPARAD